MTIFGGIGIVLTALLFLLLLFLFLKFSRWEYQQETDKNYKRKKKSKKGKFYKEQPCPLCGHLLEIGENVFSVVYPGINEKLTTIYGCPHCYQKNKIFTAAPLAARHCPVCGLQLLEEEGVYARMFLRPEKKHVHVLGCSRCRRKSPS